MMTLRSIALPALAVALSTAAQLHAQAHRGPPVPVLSMTRPADGTHVFSLAFRRTLGDSMAPIGTMTVVQQTRRDGGDRVVRRAITFDYGANRRVLDTTVSVARTLLPVSERTYKPNGAIRLDVERSIVTGQLTAGDTTRAIHDTLQGPAFNSTDLELVVRSLPLALHYQARIPIYDPELGGYRVATADVTARSASGDEWIVAVRDREVQLTYRVAVATRELVSAVIVNPTTGSEYRIMRLPHHPSGH